MAPKEIVYEPLREDERSSDETDHAVILQHYAIQTKKERWTRIAGVVCVLAMLISNAIWFSVYNRQKNVQCKSSTVSLVLHVNGSPTDTVVTFHQPDLPLCFPFRSPTDSPRSMSTVARI